MKGRRTDSKGSRKDFYFRWEWKDKETTLAKAGGFTLEVGVSSYDEYTAGVWVGDLDEPILSYRVNYKTRVWAQHRAERMLERLIEKHYRIISRARTQRGA